MAMQDYREVLAQLQQQFKETPNETDVMGMVEHTNPNLDQNSKSYKEGNKYVFKQPISYEMAQELIETVTQTNTMSLSQYKEKLASVCNNAWIMDESPIEMMIYASKCLKPDSEYFNAVLDALKAFYEKDERLEEVYSTILKNWSWNECLRTVLRSTADLKLKALAPTIYGLFENNEVIRKEAAFTLIAMGEEQYFESMINLFITRRNETREELDEIRELMLFMGQNAASGSTIIHKVYMTRKMRPEVSNQLIPGIRKNITAEILKEVENVLKNPSYERSVHIKLTRFLERTNSNEGSQRVYQKVKNYEHLRTVIGGIDGDGVELKAMVEIINKPQGNYRDTVDAIIAIGKCQDPKAQSVLEALYNKSDAFRILAGSALVERGNKRDIITLYTYLLAKDKDEKIIDEAMRQLRRLRFLQNDEINKNLLNVADTLLKRCNEKVNPEHVLRILELYSVGIPNDEIGHMYLNQLAISEHPLIKQVTLEFLMKNHNKFGKLLQKQVREVMISKSQGKDGFAKDAMEALNKMSKSNDAVPVVGGY